MAQALGYSETSVLDALRGHQASAGYWITRASALAAAVAGPLPLVLDMRLGIAMSDAASILWPLSILLVLASVLVAQRVGDRYFVRIVLVSLLSGYMATATYDSSRIAGISAGLTPMDEAMDFGARLSGQIAPGSAHSAHAEQKGQGAEAEGQATTPHHGDEHQAHAQSMDQHQAEASIAPAATVALGYAWHYWAGIMFSLSYLVLFGARRWWAAIPYILVVIYTGMVITMGVHSLVNFVWEAIGHIGFGLTLGIVSYALFTRQESPYET